MSRFIQKQGFTLIELMVVIVIIGVLASLAIPRFSEASAKAKMSEAPLVLKSFENGVLAASVETANVDELGLDEVVVDAPKDSKWWKYGVDAGNTADQKITEPYVAEAKGNMGAFKEKNKLSTTFEPDGIKEGDDACFTHDSEDNPESALKMVPMFMNSGCYQNYKDKGKS
jgi:prepilin-type N-terminal cleavage/methylation domain-containing protein